MVAATMRIKGERFVIVPAAEYERLVARRRGEEEVDLPAVPKPLRNGNYDAISYARASLARKLVRGRRAAGLSQAKLARRAGIRAQTLDRIERLKLTPSVAMVDKIDRALAKVRTSVR